MYDELFSYCTYLCVPEVRAKIIALFAKLQSHDFMHGGVTIC